MRPILYYGNAVQTLAEEIIFLETDKKLTKPELEERQLLQFQKAITAKTKHLDFSSFEAKEPPEPDFTISRSGKSVGLDIVAFAYNSKRRIQSQFSEIKQMFIDAHDQGKLRQYRYFGFTLTFHEDALRKPQQLKPAVLELIKILDEIKIDYDLINSRLHLAHSDPTCAIAEPLFCEFSDSNNTISLYVDTYGQFPANEFMRKYGFEVSHQHEEYYQLQDIKSILDSRIADHDKKEYDELLIVAGGPDNNGKGNRDEPTAANFFIQQNGKISAPKYLKRIILFNWLYNTIDILHEIT